jgi:hypothetical protein
MANFLPDVDQAADPYVDDELSCFAFKKLDA